jgi:hypothetical protein
MLGLMMVPISGRPKTPPAPRALDAERRTRELGGVLRGQVHVEQAQRGDLAEFEQVARDRGQQRGQVGADVGHRKRDLDLGTVEHSWMAATRHEGDWAASARAQAGAHRCTPRAHGSVP